MRAPMMQLAAVGCCILEIAYIVTTRELRHKQAISPENIIRVTSLPFGAAVVITSWCCSRCKLVYRLKRVRFDHPTDIEPSIKAFAPHSGTLLYLVVCVPVKPRCLGERTFSEESEHRLVSELLKSH